MTDRNPGWTLVSLTGNKKDPDELVVYGTAATNFSGVSNATAVSASNLKPGDLLVFQSHKAWFVDSTAGSTIDLSFSEFSFDKSGSASVTTLYESFTQYRDRNTGGTFFGFPNDSKAAYSVNTPGDFQIGLPTQIDVVGDTDFIRLNDAHQTLEVWRPILPNVAAFQIPAFPFMRFN